MDHLTGLIADLPQSRSARELEETRRRMDVILDSMTEGVFGLDLDGRINFFNPAARSLLGYSTEQFLHADPDELIRCGDEYGEEYERPSPFKQVIESSQQLRISDEVFWPASGVPIPVEYTCSPLAIAGVTVGALVVFSDVAERRAAEKRLEYLARFDSLTGLANRVLFHEMLGASLAKARRNERCVALLFCDLDRFKSVNDTFGHESGDGVLVETARRIRSCVRETDLPCRLAGDEFAVIIDEVQSFVDVEAIAARLVHALGEPFTISGQQVDVGGSVGVAFYPHDAGDGRELFRAADQAMYDAKHAGRGGWARARSRPSG